MLLYRKFIRINVFQFGLDRLLVSSGEFINDIFQSKVPISVFDKVNAIESTGVAILGLYSNWVELVLRSVGDQHVYGATVIRFRCSSERIQKFGRSFFWEMKCHPVCPFSIVRVDDETLGSVLYSGGELVGATHGRRQIFKVAFYFVIACAFYPIVFSLASLGGMFVNETSTYLVIFQIPRMSE